MSEYAMKAAELDRASMTEQLAREIDRLNEAVTLLEQRIEPVLAPSMPDLDSIRAQEAVPRSPLADRVEHLRYAIGRLDAIIRRVEA